MSANFSTNSMGARCGSSFLICSTSSTISSVITAASLILVLPAPLGQPRQGVHFPCPFSYRFRWRTAIIDPALQHHPGRGTRPRRQPGVGADIAVVAYPHLAAHDHMVPDHAAAGDA